MAQSFAKHFYNSREWIKCRNAYIKYRQSRDGGICEECHEKIGYIVHHRIPLSEDNIENPNIALDFNNLKYVCLDCHNEEHNGGKIKGMVKYTFAPEGEVIPVAEGKRQTPPLIEGKILTIRDRPLTSEKYTGHHKRGVV